MTLIHVTKNRQDLEFTISEMMECSRVKALSIEVLLKAVMMLPLQTCLSYDKIYGRWIFSNQDESFWPKMVREGHAVSGVNFTFIDMNPEIVLAQGIYYYYHTKIKE